MKLVTRLLVFSLFVLSSFAAFAGDSAKPKIMPLDEVRPGMRGTAYTVFEGVLPEPMEVEVLGVLRNVTGPKGDVILVRLHGKKVEHTGVVAGMSGSPVYIDGRLVGALAFRIGQFSKEPIGGLTPIEQMLEISELDRSIPAQNTYWRDSARNDAAKVSGGANSDMPEAQPWAQHMVPIGAPMVFSGFSEDTLERFAAQFASAGIVPVMGAGGASDEKQPEPIVPGSAVSAVLVRGDMNVAATCTVTYVDPERMLACGHPLMQFGSVEMPMTKATVLATLASPFNAFKIINTTEAVGAIVQDRHTGILGRFGKQPRMIPVTLTVHGGSRPRQYKYEVLYSPKLSPVAMMATVFNALQGVNEYGEDTTYRMQGRIAVEGFPDVKMENMYSPADGNIPTAFAVALSLGDRFGRIFDNPHVTPSINGVDLSFHLVRERRSARLESARTDVTEARPGDDIVVEVVLRPYRGERIVRQVPVRIPTSAPKGTLRILVSDADTLDRARRISPSFARRLDLGSTIALLNKEHVNHHLYVSLLQSNPQAMVEDKVMPALPLSVMNVMDGMRGTQDMVVVGESAVQEASTPLDYVVSGAQIISISVK